MDPDLFDVLVVGAGPVGIAVGIEATRQGLSHVVVDRGALANTLVNWPSNTIFFSTPELLEIGGLPFVASGPKPSRREGLVYYRKAAARYGLNVKLYEEVTAIRRVDELFEVTTSKATYGTRVVVVATGFFDNPNLLHVPGEGLPKVSHYYKEPFPYTRTNVLVVGGKNSAVEAALDLCRHGARVTMAVRKPALGATVKYWLRPDIENRIKEGSITAHFETSVQEITPTTVRLVKRGDAFEIENDFVLALTGYHPDYDFLRKVGIEVTPGCELVVDESTMETTVPGLYVAGVVAAGVHIGRLFIENGRNHAVQIVSHVLSRLGRAPSTGFDPLALRRFQDGD